MITLGGFIIGIIMMVAGFLAVARTDSFLRYLGDISSVFGLVGARWLSWKIFGVILLVLGFLFAFGLFNALFSLTLGRLFFIGQ